MDKQLDDLITNFARALRELAPGAQNVSVSVNVYNNNRVDWNVSVQQVGEDRWGYSKNKALSGEGPAG
jgi:hypothetical protein